METDEGPSPALSEHKRRWPSPVVLAGMSPSQNLCPYRQAAPPTPTPLAISGAWCGPFREPREPGERASEAAGTPHVCPRTHRASPPSTPNLPPLVGSTCCHGDANTMGQVGSLLPGNEMPEVQDWLRRAEGAARMRKGRRNALGGQARPRERQRAPRGKQTGTGGGMGREGPRGACCAALGENDGAKQTQGLFSELCLQSSRAGQAGQRGPRPQTRNIVGEMPRGKSQPLTRDPARRHPLELRFPPLEGGDVACLSCGDEQSAQPRERWAGGHGHRPTVWP